MTDHAKLVLQSLAEVYPNGDYALSLLNKAGASCVPCINAALGELEDAHLIEPSVSRYVGSIPRKHWRLTLAGYNLALRANPQPIHR